MCTFVRKGPVLCVSTRTFAFRKKIGWGRLGRWKQSSTIWRFIVDDLTSTSFISPTDLSSEVCFYAGDCFWVKVPAMKMWDKQRWWCQRLVEGLRASDGIGTLLLTGLGDFRWTNSHSEALIYQSWVETCTDLGAGIPVRKGSCVI